jgi:signal transduction histidine kinase
LSASLANTGVPVLIAAGTVTAVLPVSVVIHLLHACPSGRLEGKVSRATVASAYVVGLVLQAPQYLFRPADPPYDVLVLADQPGLALAGERAQKVGGAVVVAVTAWLLVRRLREHGRRQRWALAPLFGFGVLAVVAVPVVENVLRPLLGLGQQASVALQLIALATVPLGFLGVVLLGGFARTGELNAFVTALVSSSGSSRDLEEAVATTLGDPSAALLRWSPAEDAYVDVDGRPTPLPDDGRAALHVEIGNRRIGAVVYDPSLGTDPAAVAAVGRVTAIAMDREQLAHEVVTSRAALRQASSRLLGDTDRERRRIARDLHDGLQVSLVRMSMQIGRLVQEPSGVSVGPLVSRLATEVDEAATALRALVHGVMPPPLVERGLAAAVRELAYDLPVRARLDLDDEPERLPAAVESTAYFIVAEALTNVVKHAGATDVRVVLRRSGGSLRIDVLDDGHGGARLDGPGTGLTGLQDRVDVLGGTLRVDSRPGGTRLQAVLPCA